MKALLLAISIPLLPLAVHGAPPPAQIALGDPRHRVEPPGSAIPGYKSIEFPVRVTNTSKAPVWFFSQIREWPFHSLFVRTAANALWVDRTQPMCGTGASFHQLDPGETLSFKVSMPADLAGQQMRVELAVFDSPSDRADSRTVKSETTAIK